MTASYSNSTFFDVKELSELLDMGVIMGYGTVCASVLVLRCPHQTSSRCVWSLVVLALATTIPCLAHGNQASNIITCLLLVFPLGAILHLLHGPHKFQPIEGSTSFACPLVPWVPILGVILNVYLLISLSIYAWIRLALLFILLFTWYAWRVVGQRRGWQEQPPPGGGGPGERTRGGEFDYSPLSQSVRSSPYSNMAGGSRD